MKETPSRPHITFPRRRVVTPETRRMCEPHWADLGPDDVTDSVTSRERTLADCLRTLPRDQALCIADSALRGGFAPSSLVALAAGAWPVVIAAILCSIVAVFFYVRVIVLMFFVDGEAGDGEVAVVTKPSLMTSGTILVGVAATLVLGIVPGPVLDLAANAGQFVR